MPNAKNSYISSLFANGPTVRPGITPRQDPAKIPVSKMSGYAFPAANTSATGTQPTPAASAAPSAGQAYMNSISADTNSSAMSDPMVAANGLANNTPAPKRDYYREAFDAYIGTLTPSDAETNASKYLTSLVDRSKREEEDALNRGETLGFAAGEAARANRNRSFDITAASDALNAVTTQRTGARDAQKARLDYEKSLIPQEKSISEQFGSGAIGEYNFAKSQGYGGSFTDYQNEDANRKRSITNVNMGGLTAPGGAGLLSPLAQAVQNGTISIDKIPIAQRAQVAAELATSGIPSDRQNSLTANLGVVNALIDNPNKNKISGFVQGKLRLGDISPSAQEALNQFNQLKGILSLENRQLLKGSGAISDFEFKVLSDAATALGRNLGDAEFNAQLTKIKEVFEGKYAHTRAGSGLPATPTVGKTTSGVTPSGITYTVSK